MLWNRRRISSTGRPRTGMGVEETFTHLAFKASRPPDKWKSGCELQVFEAIMFSEV
jgi:AMMECR1 domain-containing protein